jgi:hypothetical protein
MANVFTGDFDVVAECSMPAANRVLAGMQRVERFPHSMALHIDDKQHLHPVVGTNPVAVELIDAFGDTTVNHRHIGPPGEIFGAAVGTSATLTGLDALLNGDFIGATEDPITPSNLSGKAQLQVSPPTIEVADAAAGRIRIRMQLMARYFADPGTANLPEFFRGELQLTTSLTQTVSQVGNVVEVDLKASSVGVVFVPSWSSAPLSAQDVAALELAVRNALKTAVLPSNVSLPANITQVAFKTLSGAQSALAMALRLRPGSANPAAVNNMFLSGGDDFAIAVGAEYVQTVVQPIADAILAQPVITTVLSYHTWLHTFNITYTLTLHTAVFSLEPGNIVLTVTGHAHTTHTLLPDFDFTARFPFSLVPDGPTANLVGGPISLDTSSWVVNMFRAAATSGMSTVRDQALAQSGANTTVRNSLNAQSVLGGMLDALLEPIPRRLFPIVHLTPRAALAYKGIGISPDGIVLHGALGVEPWAGAHVEFEQIPADGGNRPVPAGMFPQGPDYSALKSWIPGGSIHEFEWSHGTNQAGFVDDNRFVYLQPPPAADPGIAARSTLVSGFTPMCLTVRGTRISASGPISPQAVTGSVCSYSSFPVVGLNGGKVSAMPMIALTHPTPNGLQVVGHTAAVARGVGRRTPNVVVHFTRGGSVDRVSGIVRAIGDAKRPDAPTAILVVVPRGQLAGKALPDGAAYSEEDPAWEKIFGVGKAKGAETLIVGPDGRVHWRQEGDVEVGALGSALRKHLVSASMPELSLLTATARLGHAPPNFLFPHAPGKQITIRKTAGHPTTIVFWCTASEQSVDAVLELQRQPVAGGLLLAVNDGDPPEVVAKVAASHKFTAIVVPDPAREISAGYGVSVWPTVVSVDSFGVVTSIQYARMENPAAGAKASAKRSSPGHLEPVT